MAIVSIGTVLKKLGYDVLVYDADFTRTTRDINFDDLPLRYPDYLNALKNYDHPIWREAQDVVQAFNPDIVGLTVYTTLAASAFHLVSLCKLVSPRCVTVLGGPHAAVKAEEILNISTDTDFVLRGEGEKNLPILIDHLRRKFSLEDVPGLSFRQNGAHIHNHVSESTRDLDVFPSPDRSLLMNEHSYSHEDMGLIMSSRGCPFNCSYCSSETRRVSYRSIDHILKEIREVQKKYGTFQFTFKDDSFTVDRKRVKEFCEKQIRTGVNINWECNTRVNLVDISLLKLMKRAGCNFVKVGIESGSERILQTMNKGITREHCLQASKMLRRSGIHWTGYFMIGVPGEKEDDIGQTLKFMYDLQPDLALLSVYEPFPGTEMFRDGVIRGLVYEDMNIEQYYNLIPTHYYKKDPDVQTDTIPKEKFLQLEKMITDEFHHYNKKIERVFKMAFARRYSYLYRPSTIVDDIRKFLSY